MGKKTPKIAPSPWDFITLPEEDRATATGNMQQKFGKHSVVWFGRYACRQTHTQTRSLQYFTTAPKGEVATITTTKY